MEPGIVVLAGATGDLGGRIARALRERGAGVRAIVRHSSSPDRVEALRKLGVEIAEVEFGSSPELIKACRGGSCMVSVLAGLRDVIVQTQALLLDAAIVAGVPRFIPSDFSIDFTKLQPGTNRNLDLRREFHQRLEGTAIAATSILNGMFAELLTGQAPYILFKLKRVVYWGDPDQEMDFTTKDDTAAFTAAAALDPASPRFLRIAGDQCSARQLAGIASEVTGERFRLLRAGRLGTLRALIKITRSLLPRPDDLYPPWQGMQYMANMFSGHAKLAPLDNTRYPSMRWTSVRDVLTAGQSR